MPLGARRRKGQTLVVEEVMLVGISIVTLAGIVAMFSIMEDRVGTTVRSVQGEIIGEHVLFNVEKMTEYTNARGSVTLEIPAVMGGEGYSIIANGTALFLRFENGESKVFPVYGGVPVIGGVSSGTRRVTIRNNGTAIILGG